MKCFDISVSIEGKMPTYPGDPAFELSWLKTIDRSPFCLSMFSMSSHCGTHVDSPKHFVENGQSIDEIGIEQFCGNAVLVSAEGKKTICPEDLQGFDIKEGEIFLLKTDNSFYMHSGILTDKFATPSKEAAVFLAEKGIKAFGFDYITVDNNEDFPVHNALLSSGIPIIEGLDLYLMEPGRYLFAGFPLKIKSAEASPIRAILLKE